MPKLDGTQIAERIQRRLEELRRGEEVAPRDIRALLTEEQEAAIDAAWAEQQALRKKKRARTKEEAAALGVKTKRDIHIEVLEAALNAAKDTEVEAWEKRLRDAEVRGARIYLDAYFSERDKGIDEETARTRANNALTRAGLQRLDGVIVGKQGLTKRDREIREMEDAILKRHEDEMTPEEREQLELLREHEKAVLANRKKRGW